jgi:hypothetical protein
VSLPPAIWLGDAGRAVAALRADRDAVEAIVRLLGLLPEDAPPSGDLPPPVPPVPPPALPPPPPLPPPTPSARAVAVAEVAHRTEVDGRADPPTVERLDGPPSAMPPLPSLAEVLAPPPPSAAPVPADLFHADRQRAVLTALCSGPASTGEPDVDAAVEIVARGEPLLALPPTVRPTTRRGLQLLVDQGEAMLPFARDQEQVRRAIGLLTGPDGFEVVRFARTPLDPPGAGPGPIWTWRTYRPQIPGQPVLVLSDLGVLAPRGNRADVEDAWCRFAALLHEAGCPLVALAPTPLRRVSPRVRAALAVVPWDRPTGVRDAVAAARRAGGRVHRGRS